MRIIADANIAMLEETFDRHGKLRPLGGREIRSGDLRDADVLLVRSVTQVGAALLENTPVKFVGTATIGTDHLDIPWLEAQGIHWASAPGCNADAAAQYTLGMLVLACRRLDRKLAGQRVGIIGRGNVGSRLQRLLDVLGVASVACDPPLADGGATGLVDLDTALQQDIISLHVPLTRDGPHPTHHLLDSRRLPAMKAGSLLVNTARGDVVDGPSLLCGLRAGRLHVALDVWPGEPRVDPRLVEAALVATPHVAGYSIEGKRRGTQMIYEAFLDWLGQAQPQEPYLERPCAQLELGGRDNSLDAVLRAVCGTARDDEKLRHAMRNQDDDGAFDRLRAGYPLRHDFGAWALAGLAPAPRELFRRLGFRIAGEEPARRAHC